MDCSLQSSSIHGIFQARVLEWVAISFSRGSSQPRDQTQVSHIVGRHFTVWATREALITYLAFQGMHVCLLHHFSHVQLFATLWTLAHQAALSMGYSRQEYWNGLPCPPASKHRFGFPVLVLHVNEMTECGLSYVSLPSLNMSSSLLLSTNLDR